MTRRKPCYLQFFGVSLHAFPPTGLLADVCRDIGRPERLRHARTYVAGLLDPAVQPKTIRRIAQGSASTSLDTATYNALQNFITGRPGWDALLVLRRTAERLAARVADIDAWVLVRMRFPYLGESRILAEPQRAMALHAVGRDDGGQRTPFPLAWELSLTDEWLRARPVGARSALQLPDHVEVGPKERRFEHVSAVADELIDRVASWDLDRGPIVTGGRHRAARWLWRQRGLEYVMNTDPRRADEDERRAQERHGYRFVAGSRSLVTIKGRRWQIERFQDSRGRPDRSDEWVFRPADPSGDVLGTWATNVRAPLERLIGLAELREGLQTYYDTDLSRLGMGQYRGNSYGGWQRHLAMVAVAYACEVEARHRA